MDERSSQSRIFFAFEAVYNERILELAVNKAAQISGIQEPSA